jgi:transcription-repair coupling factor (superfamily II helicase)
MSLTGLRDISLIETPPKDRLSIHTVVTTFSRELIASAVRKELARDGQVYFVHNRVEDIESLAGTLVNWIPEARVVVAHGQMSGAELEKRMLAFVEREADILLSTTIIENGIDIPLVNTLIVNRADRFGLAQLYQLRGRVGRSSRQARAYFLVPSFTGLTPVARERLRALQEFSELGSGFRLAAKDLEIRGAGSFLGSRQHGVMEAVGFEYYLHLLETAVRKIKGEAVEDVKSTLNLRVDIRIPERYQPQTNLRLNLYKRVSAAADLEEINRIAEDIRDRYGPFPRAVDFLIRYGRSRVLARGLKIESVDRIGGRLVVKFHPESTADPGRLAALLRKRGGSMTPQGVMSLPLQGSGDGAVLDETIRILMELSDV